MKNAGRRVSFGRLGPLVLGGLIGRQPH